MTGLSPQAPRIRNCSYRQANPYILANVSFAQYTRYLILYSGQDRPSHTISVVGLLFFIRFERFIGASRSDVFTDPL